jgi:hypothetical protein
MKAPIVDPVASSASPENGMSRGAGVALLVVALVAGVTLRLSGWIEGELWLDEYHTLILAGASSVREVLAFTAAEAHPPLYLLGLHLFMRLLGDDPLIAKGLSVAFGVAALLLVAAVAWHRWGRGASAVAAALLGGSAIAVHFSTEVRPYSVVALTLLLGVLTTVAAVERPSARTYLAQGASLLAALALNFFALTLLPVGPLLALLRRRGRLFLHQALMGTVVLLATSPPLIRVATQLPLEANEYVQTLWSGRTALDALVAVARDLLPSGRWPPSYGPGASRSVLDPALEGLAVVGALLVLAGGAVAVARRRPGAGPGLLEAGCAALLVSAAALTVASFALGRPVVTPGRFAASFVPVSALLGGAAVTWGRAGRAGAVLLAVVAFASAAAALLARDVGIRVDRTRVAAIVVAKDYQHPLLVLSVGLTGTPLKYELRERTDVEFASFPPDVDEHFGWWAPAKALGEPAALARDAGWLARRAVEAASQGRTVLVTGADHPVATPLRAALDRYFVARPLHELARGSFVLVLRREPPGPVPAGTVDEDRRQRR